MKEKEFNKYIEKLLGPLPLLLLVANIGYIILQDTDILLGASIGYITYIIITIIITITNNYREDGNVKNNKESKRFGRIHKV